MGLRILLLLCLVLLVPLDAKLEQVSIIVRHGARYYFNPLYDASQLATKKGQLSAVGMRQQENLGQILIEHYGEELGFIGTSYEPGQIEALTPDDNRSVQSLRSLLYGMYPLGSGPKLDKVPDHFYLPPFPGVEDAEERQYALPEGFLPFPFDFSYSFFPCVAFNATLQNTLELHKEELQEMTEYYKPFITRMGKMFNITQYLNVTTMALLADSVEVARYLGRPLPSDFTEEDEQNLMHMHEWFFFISVRSNLSKAMNTQKLERMIKAFDGRISNPQQKTKMSLYVTHDTDLGGLMVDLNMTTVECIQERYRFGKTNQTNCDSTFDFTSSFALELHSEEGEYFMKLKHDGVYVNFCGGDSKSCPYQEWKSSVEKSLILKDYDKICSGEISILTDLGKKE